MLFCQVWIPRRTTITNLTKLQTFPLENPFSSNSGLWFSLVFLMCLCVEYKSSAVYNSNSPEIFFILRSVLLKNVNEDRSILTLLGLSVQQLKVLCFCQKSKSKRSKCDFTPNAVLKCHFIRLDNFIFLIDMAVKI